jgi:hypothetical protein
LGPVGSAKYNVLVDGGRRLAQATAPSYDSISPTNGNALLLLTTGGPPHSRLAVERHEIDGDIAQLLLRRRVVAPDF